MPSVTGSPTTIRRMTMASMTRASVRRTPQRLDLARDAMAFVGNDALDHREPVLHRTKFGAQLGIFLADQLDAFHRLVAGPGIDRLAPAVFERIAMLDAEPGRENPAADSGKGDNDRYGGNRFLEQNEVHYLS